jgi:basic amino acid/polyamine antiporter, APA family
VSLFHATALVFVAYSGYARITTLGEEVYEPRRTIPRAIVVTLAVSATLYIAVATIAVASVGPDMLRAATEGEAAPLEIVAREFPIRGVSTIVAIGAMLAMIGVLLNLLLGLSRVLLAMGRRRDVPEIVATLNERRTTPYVAVLVVGAVVAALALIGSVKTTWTFSAFTVLMYYAITNLAALRLPETQRIYSRWFARAGLAACLFLAFWVEWQVWTVGLGLIAFGLVWHRIAAIRRTRVN